MWLRLQTICRVMASCHSKCLLFSSIFDLLTDISTYQTYRLYISNQMLVHLPKLIYTPKWLYESRDFNHIKSSFESVRVCYYLRECVEVIALFCCTAPRLSNYPCMWRLELNIFSHLASFKCMTIIQAASHVIILYQGCYS